LIDVTINGSFSGEAKMDFERVKKEISVIIEIVSTLPEQYQVKCFELVLNASLRQMEKTALPIHNELYEFEQGKSYDLAQEEIPITTELRIFMQKHNISMDMLKKVIMFADNDVHFLKEPTNMSITEGQISWALLLAIKNAILKGRMETDPEDVRSICKAKGFYNMANFAKNFKRTPYSNYFKSTLEPQGSPKELSNEGETALAQLILNLHSGE
jgi:hypothetical protein